MSKSEPRWYGVSTGDGINGVQTPTRKQLPPARARTDYRGYVRPITNDDLWSAIRGCAMTSCTKANLEAIIESHKDSPTFASKVIVEAARQCIAGRLYLKE